MLLGCGVLSEVCELNRGKTLSKLCIVLYSNCSVFQNFTWMATNDFEMLLGIILHQHTVFQNKTELREAISAKTRLEVTLQYCTYN